MKILLAAIAFCAVALTGAPGTANAAQRTACQMLPASTVQTILGSAVMTPGTGAVPIVGNGVTSYQCFYVGEKGGASLFIFYNETAAQASLQASTSIVRFERMGAGHGSSLAGSKGNVAFMVSVRNPADAGKLKALLAAAMKNA